MTKLSVNLNKIALLRNSRGRDFPNVVAFAKKFIGLGVHGITIHPRPDERHIHRRDAYDLADCLINYPGVELNIEGYPTEDFLRLIEDTQPDQCTLVPDAENQLTSDHGWDLLTHGDGLRDTLSRIKEAGVRCATFLDPDCAQVECAAAIGVDRIELYTEAYASAFEQDPTNSGHYKTLLQGYANASALARQLGVGVNAGHDLDLHNLPAFLSIGGVLEVSIGHVLTVECIEQGMANVVRQYLHICAESSDTSAL